MWDGLDPSTPSQNWRAYSVLKSVMIDAVEDGLADRDPWTLKDVGKPKPKHKAEVMTTDELRVYFAAVPVLYRLPLMGAVLCGLRSGEVQDLRRRDVDLPARTLHVEQAATRVQRDDGDGYRWRLDDPKTDAADRVVSMPSRMVPPMRQRLARLPVRGRDQLISTATDGRSPIASSVLWEAHEKGRRAVGGPTVTVHHCARRRPRTPPSRGPRSRS